MRAKVWSEIMKERALLEDIGVDRRLVLKWILEKQSGRVWMVMNRVIT
jgi:hypothetical protein